MCTAMGTKESSSSAMTGAVEKEMHPYF